MATFGEKMMKGTENRRTIRCDNLFVFSVSFVFPDGGS